MKPTKPVQLIGAWVLLFTLAACRTAFPQDGPAGLLAPASATEGLPDGALAQSLAPAASVGIAETDLLPAAVAVLEAANVLRSIEGREPLSPSPILTGLAFRRAGDMVEGRYLAHVDPNGASPAARELLSGAGYAAPVAELLLATEEALGELPLAAVSRWNESPANRSVLLDPTYRFAGVGLRSDGTWWKVVLLMAEAEPGS